MNPVEDITMATLRISAYLSLVIAANVALGHGIPIEVGVDGGGLVVANGCSGVPSGACAGYAPMVFADGSADALLDDTALPGFTLTDEPGFDLNGVAAGSGLYLNVLALPVVGSTPAVNRLLWHWHLDANPQNSRVMVDPAGESLMISSNFADITLPQTGAPLPPSLEIAEPTADEVAAGHNHFLTYVLGNPSPNGADIGAYGFFARLTSPSYAPTEPFLVILNNGLDAGTLLTAAQAINAAAGIGGDYNGNGIVDAADYTVWRDKLGTMTSLPNDTTPGSVTQADYDVWKSDFGSHSGSGAGANAAIPEPATLLLLLVGILTVCCRRRPMVS
jgi:PEP-CTERM motif